MCAATYGPEEANPSTYSIAIDSSSVVKLNTIHPALRQFFLCTAFMLCWILAYALLQVFVVAFSKASGGAGQVVWFFMFVVMNMAVKDALCRIGYLIDLGKRGSVSMFFVGSLIGSLLYFSFYRYLFERVYSYTAFVALQVVHVAAEWFTYVYRSSNHWFRIVKTFPKCLQFFLINGPQSVRQNDRDMACFRTNSFAIRIVVFVYSSIAYLAFKIFIVFGWNKPYFGTSSALSNHDMDQLVIFLALSAIIEIFNAALMNKFFFEPRKLNLVVYISFLFRHGRPFEFQELVCFLSVAMFCNVFVPFVENDFGDIGSQSQRNGAFIGAVVGTFFLVTLSLNVVVNILCPKCNTKVGSNSEIHIDL